MPFHEIIKSFISIDVHKAKVINFDECSVRGLKGVEWPLVNVLGGWRCFWWYFNCNKQEVLQKFDLGLNVSTPACQNHQNLFWYILSCPLNILLPREPYLSYLQMQSASLRAIQISFYRKSTWLEMNSGNLTRCLSMKKLLPFQNSLHPTPLPPCVKKYELLLEESLIQLNYSNDFHFTSFCSNFSFFMNK